MVWAAFSGKFWRLPPGHAASNGAVPPLGVNVPTPSLAPGRLAGDCWAQASTSAAGSPMVAEAVAAHPFASVTVEM